MSETTALVSTDPNAALVLASLGDNGLTGLVDEGYVARVSKIEMIQPINAKEGEVAGTFKDKQSNEVSKTRKVIPLEFQCGRVLFPEGGELGAKPICRSDNGKFPIINDQIVRQDGGKGCAKCPMAQWKTIKGQGGKTVKVRPACMETMSLLFLDAETGFPHRINAKGTNLPPMKDFREVLFKKVMAAKMKKQVLPHFGLVATMATTKVVGKKGTFYILVFNPPAELNTENSVIDLSQAYNMYKTLVLEKNFVEETDPVDAAVEEAVADATQEYVEG